MCNDYQFPRLPNVGEFFPRYWWHETPPPITPQDLVNFLADFGHLLGIAGRGYMPEVEDEIRRAQKALGDAQEKLCQLYHL